MKLRVNVTAEDIKDGKKGSCQSCPIALAVQCATKYRYIVYASHGFLELNDSVKRGKRFMGTFSPKVKDRIVSYDKNGKMESFSFQITLKEQE